MKHALALPLISSALLVPLCAQAAVVTTTGVYDESAFQTNAVDTDATGTLTAFKTSVASAFASGFGGVAGFEEVFTATTAFDLTYASGTKTLHLTSSAAQNSTAVALAGTVIPISAAAATSDSNRGGVLTRATGVNPDTTFTVGTITGGAFNEQVVSFAFTLLERNSYTSAGISYTVTAYYSNGTNSGGVASVIGDVITATSNKGTDDTFWSFTAPAGASITSIFIDSAGTGTTTATQPVFDDVAFITAVVPEPSSILVSGAALGLALLRRRRA